MSVAASSRPRPGIAATTDPLYGIRRVLRRRRDRLSTKARARLQTGLIAGDPDGEVTLAWTVAQDLMGLYRLDDSDRARAQATALIADLRGCPIPELARLGRTMHAWQHELCAHFDHPDVSNGPTENLNLKIKNTKRIARGYRNFTHYRLRLLLNHGRTHENHTPGASEPAVRAWLRRASNACIVGGLHITSGRTCHVREPDHH